MNAIVASLRLCALTLLICGPGAMRILWLPILYLAFAVKLPDALWAQIASGA